MLHRAIPDPVRRGLRISALGVGVVALVTTAAAQTGGLGAGENTSYSYGNLTFVEGDVWHQRADDFGANEAERNSPFLPGDRIWTREEGQAEFRLAGGVLVWIDAGTKLDYVEGDRPHRLGFWTGSLALVVPEDAPVVVETPGGALTPQGAGEFRTDLLPDGRTVQFLVYDGIATVATDHGSVLVSAGQRTLAAEGAAPAPVETFERDLTDDAFLAWAGDRQERHQQVADAPVDELPEEIRDHVSDLHGHGRWHYDVYLGWQWYPFVSDGWAPYRLGRWAYTPFGYTWVSHDPWGWAPFHYGRWGHGRYGWYWVPGRVWGPGWVSWAYGPDWVAWGPMNLYGYPTYSFYEHGVLTASGGRRRGQIVGKAVRRDSRMNRRAWSATSRAAVGTPASARRLGTARVRQVDQVLARGATLDRGLARRADGETGMVRAARATTRRLSNGGNIGTAVSRGERTTARAQRIASPSARARAAASRADRPAAVTAPSGRTRATARSSASSRREASRSTTGERAAPSTTVRSGARRGSRPPRPRASGSRSGTGARRPSAVRPPATSRGRPSSARPSTRRPSSSTPSRSRPSSARPSSTRRPSSSTPSRSRPSSARPSTRRPSSSTPSRSRPSSARPSSTRRPSSSTPSRSRPSSARPSSTRRPSSSTPSRSRPSSARPSSTRRPSSSTPSRSRPSSARPSTRRPSASAPSRGRPAASSRTRPNSSTRSRPSASSSSSRSTERRRPNNNN